MIVVDASVLVDLLCRSRDGDAIEHKLLAGGDSLHAPHLVDIEIVHALRRLVRIGNMSPDRAEEALVDLYDLRLDRYPHTERVSRIWELRDSLTAYDAAYVALAEALDATLVTRDARLARTRGHLSLIHI